MYAVFYILLTRAVTNKHRAFAFLLALVYAISDEFHQTFVRDRHGSPVDVLIDAIGIITGFLLWKYTRKQLRKPKTSAKR